MQLSSKSLNTHLTKPLLPIYLVSSDELLFVTEARNQIIDAATKQGFSEREIMHTETGFQWETFLEALQNKSLFCEKKLIDLRNMTAKFDTKGIEALTKFLSNPSDDLIIIISTQKLTSAQQKSTWFKMIDKAGVYLPIYPLRTQEYPQWIQQRAQSVSLSFTSDAAKLLAQTTEGHLFAASQAIEKCALLYPAETITPEKLIFVISDNTQFTVFDLANALLQGDAKRAIAILSSLKQTGVEPILVLWAVARESRELLEMRYQLEQGASLAQLLSRVFTIKKPLVQQALQRMTTETLKNAIKKAAMIDRMIKGAKQGNPWDALTDVCLRICMK